MKARLVTDICATGGQPGDIEYRQLPATDDEPARPGGFAYRCPRCGQEDWLNVHSDDKGWTWNGNLEAPTLSPSILHRPCQWHGHLIAGEFVPC